MAPRFLKCAADRVTLPIVLAAALLLRLFLLLYGDWQDANFAVKFTDVDYQVFSEAAHHVTEGHSPFLRPTYRYTPLLAVLLAPNHLLFHSFGKTLFILCDVVAGCVLSRTLQLKGVSEPLRLVSVSLWLLNPLTATVSARGNAESFLAVLVLSSLFFLLSNRILLSAIAYGTAVHVKIYPVIYCVPIFLFLGRHHHTSRPCTSTTGPPFSSSLSFNHSSTRSSAVLDRVRSLFSLRRLVFSVTAIATFSLLTGFFYLLYGEDFIREAYLYHITRRDIKHNFSVYFYLLYLVDGSWLSLPVGLLAFLPQAALLLLTAARFSADITFCCFVQTVVFVTFNKVCTSQYFMWYMSLLPLIIPFTKLSLWKGALIGTLWFTGQATWLAPAYFLEFHGYNTFLFLWLASLLFFTINTLSLACIVRNHNFTPSATHTPVVKRD